MSKKTLIWPYLNLKGKFNKKILKIKLSRETEPQEAFLWQGLIKNVNRRGWPMTKKKKKKHWLKHPKAVPKNEIWTKI